MKVRWAGVRAKESCWKGRERKPARGGIWVGESGGEENLRKSRFASGDLMCVQRWTCLQDMGREVGPNSSQN